MSIDFINIAALQQEAIKNFSLNENGPANPHSLTVLKQQLTEANGKIAPLYRAAIYDPLVSFVNTLTEADFASLVQNQDQGQVFFDFVQVILQHAHKYNSEASGAFEEVVSELYDGFLSAEDRRNIKLPDHNLIAPIVKWGNPKFGPYTLPSDVTIALKAKCAIVSMPPAIAKGVLAGWSSLGHETAGHDISHADDGLLEEMSTAVRTAILADKTIKSKSLKGTLADYWSERMDETASDVMGILNMGPAAAAGMIPFFRSFLKQFGSPPVLRSQGPANDEHPADILRVMLGSATVKSLSFADHDGWSQAILKEGLKDLNTIILNDKVKVDPASAQKSATTVAKTLMSTRFEALANNAFQEIQDWADVDEKIVADLRKVINGKKVLAQDELKGFYAAHVVSAALYEGLLVKQSIEPLFTRMLALLKKMHDANPNWGPLYAIHPGNLRIDRVMKM